MRIECDRCGFVYDQEGIVEEFEFTDNDQPWFMNSEVSLSGVVLTGQDPKDIHLCP